MKQLRLRESCIQYTTTRNRYGDFVLTPQGTILCLFRNITTLNRNVNYREETTVNGIFWFAPNATVNQGDVIQFEGVFYRLEEKIVANQRLTTNATHFLKFSASLYRAIS